MEPNLTYWAEMNTQELLQADHIEDIAFCSYGLPEKRHSQKLHRDNTMGEYISNENVLFFTFEQIVELTKSYIFSKLSLKGTHSRRSFHNLRTAIVRPETRDFFTLLNFPKWALSLLPGVVYDMSGQFKNLISH